MIPINLPQIGEEELNAVTKVMRSGILTSGLGAGPKVTEFEKKFAAFASVKHAIAVNTGTAALHAAVVSVGVKPGDEIVLPSFTFVATAEAVVMAGGRPVFADIDPQTYNISSAAIRGALTEKTKAILPVDLYGLPAEIAPIRKITSDHGSAIIEDACQAHGATVKGRSAGTDSDLACWSLYASKNMTTGEGGVVTTDNDRFAEIIRLLRTHGERAKYSSTMLGYNYRMSEIQAAIGTVQLTKLPHFLAKRQQNAQELSAILKESKRIQLPTVPEGIRHSWYLFTVRIKDAEKSERDNIISDLRKAGVGSEAYYVTPIHKMPFYKENFGDFSLPETEKAANQVLSLPIHPGVTSEQIKFVGATLIDLLR